MLSKITILLICIVVVFQVLAAPTNKNVITLQKKISIDNYWFFLFKLMNKNKCKDTVNQLRSRREQKDKNILPVKILYSAFITINKTSYFRKKLDHSKLKTQNSHQ